MDWQIHEMSGQKCSEMGTFSLWRKRARVLKSTSTGPAAGLYAGYKREESKVE